MSRMVAKVSHCGCLCVIMLLLCVGNMLLGEWQWMVNYVLQGGCYDILGDCLSGIQIIKCTVCICPMLSTSGEVI